MKFFVHLNANYIILLILVDLNKFKSLNAFINLINNSMNLKIFECIDDKSFHRITEIANEIKKILVKVVNLPYSREH